MVHWPPFSQKASNQRTLKMLRIFRIAKAHEAVGPRQLNLKRF